MIIAPCKDCKDRHDLCWNGCDKYAGYRAELAEYKQNVEKEKKKYDAERKRRSRRKAIAAEKIKNKH